MRKITRHDFLRVISASGGIFPLARYLEGREKQRSNRPNIIYIMLDEWGYYELSCLGNPHLKTPVADRMIAEGMRFTQCLAGSAVCAPTRSVLMTGQHSGHTTVRANNGYTPLRADDFTIADMLKKAGYTTGGFGKWGCGGRGTSGVPEKHGFDEFIGYYDQVHAHTFFPEYLIHNSKEYPLEGNKGFCYEGKTFSQNIIFKESIKFIKKNKNRPFFCYCPWTPPHGIWGFDKTDPSWKLFKDKPWKLGQKSDEDAKVYAAMISMVDRQVGEIIELLKEQGQEENTIIFFCGDNGGADYFKTPELPRGLFGANVNPKTGVEFRGKKGQLYEGGLRIPMIVRWPGKIKPGTVSDHLSYFPDIMPTLAEIAGIKPPETTDGISMLPTLLNKGKQKQHKYLYWEYKNKVAVRMEKWKGHAKIGSDDWSLYDLEKDVSETTDVASEYPDIKNRMQAFAKEAHTPVQIGEIFDKELIDKDRSQKKFNPDRFPEGPKKSKQKSKKNKRKK